MGRFETSVGTLSDELSPLEKHELAGIRMIEMESWLHLRHWLGAVAPKSEILMSVLFNHARRYPKARRPADVLSLVFSRDVDGSYPDAQETAKT